MKLNFPYGINQVVRGDGSLAVPDSNGQIDIGVADPSPYLSLGFTLPVGVTTTSARPVPTQGGTMLFDSTLGKPIWRNIAETGWVDATGSAV